MQTPMSPAVGRPCHILGLSCFYHDSAACLLTDGHITAAAQEERFSPNRPSPHSSMRCSGNESAE